VQVSLNVAVCNQSSYVMLSSHLYGNSTGFPAVFDIVWYGLVFAVLQLTVRGLGTSLGEP